MNPAILFRAEPALLDAIDKARGETGRGRFVGDTMRRVLMGEHPTEQPRRSRYSDVIVPDLRLMEVKDG